MSKDKYPSILLKPNVGYCFYYPSKMFRKAHFGNITGYSPVFSHLMRLDNRVRAKIWIILRDPVAFQTWSTIGEQNNRWNNTNNTPSPDNKRSYRS